MRPQENWNAGMHHPKQELQPLHGQGVCLLLALQTSLVYLELQAAMVSLGCLNFPDL